jgi:hypothetical protein
MKMKMFDKLDNLDSISFENTRLKEKPEVRPTPDFSKTKEEWRDELLKFGFKEDRRMFFVDNQISPIRISLASIDFEPRCGTSPRIHIRKSALDDAIFNEIVEKADFLEIVHDIGLTFKGYNFYDVKSTKDLGNFVVGFEKLYRRLSGF